ncbi:MAG: flagellar motor protein MotA [Pseudomonadota bacterium]
MARLLERSVKFTEPGRYILNMLLFLIAAGAVVYLLSPLSPNPSPILMDAYNANPWLNGFILFVLVVGIIYNLRQAGVISPAVRWVEGFRETVDPRRARLPRPPMLISAMVKLLLDADERGGRLTPESTRAILDSIGVRMDEGREMGRYIGHLLVFLGLLGTFWGLIQTVNGVVETISGLGVTGGDPEAAITQLITNLKAPLAGMGTAFSSSLFGLSGSLVVGFLDLQSSQAQGRFYTDLEDWLSGMTDTRAGGSGAKASMSADDESPFASLEAAFAANTEALIKAQAGQMAELKDEIRALNRSFIRGKE